MHGWDFHIVFDVWFHAAPTSLQWRIVLSIVLCMKKATLYIKSSRYETALVRIYAYTLVVYKAHILPH